MISVSTPTTAIETVRHIRSGGICMIRVLPHGHVTVTYPRMVEQARQDGNGEWWFGVSLWAFQWFQFPAVGLEWTLVSNECETPKSWPAAKNLPAGVPDCYRSAGAGDVAAERQEDGSQRGNREGEAVARAGDVCGCRVVYTKGDCSRDRYAETQRGSVMRLTAVHLSYYRSRKLNPAWAKLLKPESYRPSIDACVNAHAGIREKGFDVHNAINTLQMGARNCRRKTGTSTPYRDYLTERILRYGTTTTKPAETRLLMKIAKKIGVTQQVIAMLTIAMRFRQPVIGSRQSGRS